MFNSCPGEDKYNPKPPKEDCIAVFFPKTKEFKKNLNEYQKKKVGKN